MLPTSHPAPRNTRIAALVEHPAPVVPARVPAEATLLADAFSEFIAAAARLEGSYAELQAQVAQLGLELAERNAALNASLAENERMRLALEQIVDSMPCGVLVVEEDGGLSMINPEGKRLLDLDATQVQACPHAVRPGSGLIGRRNQIEVSSLGAISAHVGIDLASFVHDHRIPDGEQEFSVIGAGGKRWIEVRNRRLYAGQQQTQRGPRSGQTILILRDVTAHKQAEQERERGRRATALAEVAAMLAHEIRNPLASLELFAGLIAESEKVRLGGGPELCWISHMRAGIRSLSGTVNNVLSFHGAGFPALTPLDLAASLESSVEFVRPIADQAGVSLSFEAESHEVMVLGSASGLQQVVLNLVANAVRHTLKGGRIHVALGLREAGADQPGRVRIEFSDTGSGIPPEHLAEIFRPGFSGSGNTSGLGLTVCGQIVRQHGGEIRVSSRPGCGTTFCVELPTL